MVQTRQGLPRARQVVVAKRLLQPLQNHISLFIEAVCLQCIIVTSRLCLRKDGVQRRDGEMEGKNREELREKPNKLELKTN